MALDPKISCTLNSLLSPQGMLSTLPLLVTDLAALGQGEGKQHTEAEASFPSHFISLFFSIKLLHNFTI
jgi:hypothetical protein